jgi:hypothetical protein
MSKNNVLRLIIFLLLTIASTFPVVSQVYLTIEQPSEVKSIKIAEGESLNFQTYEEKEWITKKIERILPQDSVIIFEDRMIYLRDIKSIRFKNLAVVAISRSLYTFGTAWITYGVIAQATGRYKLNPLDYAIVGIAIAGGFVADKLGKYRYYRQGKYVRYRLIDINFTDPQKK